MNILLFTVLGFYVFSLIVKLIFRRKMKRLQQRMEQNPDGEANAQTDEVQKPHVNPNIGEYTDFEEVE